VDTVVLEVFQKMAEVVAAVALALETRQQADLVHTDKVITVQVIRVPVYLEAVAVEQER
jgi:hypothetical protein